VLERRGEELRREAGLWFGCIMLTAQGRDRWTPEASRKVERLMDGFT
jgi:hypothetical protein